jgi:hypothetical protein
MHTDRDHVFHDKEEAEAFADDIRAKRYTEMPHADVYVLGPFKRDDDTFVVNVEIFK